MGRYSRIALYPKSSTKSIFWREVGVF